MAFEEMDAFETSYYLDFTSTYTEINFIQEPYQDDITLQQNEDTLYLH